MKLINLSKAISLPKFVLLIMERKEKKKKEKEKRKKKGKMPLTCNAACTSPENIVGFFPGKPIDF